MNQQKGTDFGWDANLSQQWITEQASEQKEKREIQDAGNYEFKIISFERKTVKPGGKYAGAPMAALKYEIGGTIIFDWIILNTDYNQKIANFMKAVFGDQQPPAGFWDQLVGRSIMLEVDKTEETWTPEDKTEPVKFFKNNVKKYLDKTLEHKMGAFEVKEIKAPSQPSTGFGGPQGAPPQMPESTAPPQDDSLPF